ncbi:hypothetical protein AwDysgo_05890 [Bacteroidales bacterium]|nr:hypothetical protein AwDysgo_05890 [Bacteroidales bacterium]
MSKGKRKVEIFNKKLLVEGNDDKHVVLALCKKCGIPETFNIIDTGGIDKLKEEISVRFKQSGINTIGILIDADVDVVARWESIKVILESINFDIPKTLPKEGLILESNNKRVGVWIMPNNEAKGMLEDFIYFLAPKNDALFPIAEAILIDIEAKGLDRYKAVHRSKALIATWLAWQEDPGTPMGLSITKKILDTESPECQSFVDWLKKLFRTSDMYN